MNFLFNITMESWLFIFFSTAMLYSGLLTITCRNAVSSAICLILVFFFMAGLFVLLSAVFLAAVQILVYAGAVMVLFLFVIMLLNVEEEERRHLQLFGIISATLVGISLFAQFVIVLRRTFTKSLPPVENLIGSTENVGRLLFSKYLLPFEVASLILLVAMVGVVLLSNKEVAK